MTAYRDKVVVVTGASSGIGQAVARRLHRLGATVVLGARRGDRLKEFARDLGDERVMWGELDVRSADSVRTLFERAGAAFGGVHGLVANAGIGAYGGICDLTDAHVRDLVETNLTGTIWCVRAAVPYLRKSGGDIVVVSSVAGLRARADEAVYAATKHALIGLAGALDRELRADDIRVMAMCPGATATEFAMGHGRDPQMSRLQTMMRPEEVAEAVAFALGQPRTMRTLLWSMRSMASEN